MAALGDPGWGGAEARAARERARGGWLLSGPAIALLLVGAAGPLLVVAVFSFLSQGDFGGVTLPFTLEAWFRVFLQRDIFDGTVTWADAHLVIFWRSLWLAAATTLLTFLLGLPTAWFIATRPERTRALWLFLITIPFWTNLLIRTFAIMEIIRNEGLLNTMLIGLGAIERPVQILLTDTATLIGMTYVYLPLMVLPLYAAIDRFDMRLLEAAYDLYASRWAVLRRVVLPLIRPGLVAGSILVFIPALGAYVVPRVLGGGRNMMIGNFIELQFGQGRNWPLGAALSMLLLLVVMLALLVYVRAAAREGRDG
jgi:spermidine/putrescine transport system permease protein